eukprot:COSAG02_NODE_2202_length_9534_cov_20.277160_11_plen_57_part_00
MRLRKMLQSCSVRQDHYEILYQLSQRQFSHGSACADLALLRRPQRLALINMHVIMN